MSQRNLYSLLKEAALLFLHGLISAFSLSRSSIKNGMYTKGRVFMKYLTNIERDQMK